MKGFLRRGEILGERLNWLIERLCALLVAVMVMAVWLGVVARYVFNWQEITWTEEFARYIMIWAALLAVSCGVYHREHVGLMLLLESIPGRLHHLVRLMLDLIGIGFFAVLTYYGFNMAREGLHQYAMIFDMNMAIPFASVPVAALLAALQQLLITCRDLAAVTRRRGGESC